MRGPVPLFIHALQAMKMPRPISVTIISIVAIIVGMYTLAIKLLVVTNPDSYKVFVEFAAAMSAHAWLQLPVAFHLAHAFTGSVVWIVSGLFMLRGKNWARVLALLWGLSVLILTLLVAHFSLPFYLKLASWLLMLYFLTRERCSHYFRGTAETGDNLPRQP